MFSTFADDAEVVGAVAGEGGFGDVWHVAVQQPKLGEDLGDERTVGVEPHDRALGDDNGDRAGRGRDRRRGDVARAEPEGLLTVGEC